MSRLSDRVQRLESVFTRIQHERMRDMPVLNHDISVCAVGFRAWEADYLGVLVTPWFMNLVLLAGAHSDWQHLRPGDKQNYSFPAGSYEFIAGEEDSLGYYQACSLFSPMFQFHNQTAAVNTAIAVMEHLMLKPGRRAGKRPTPDPDSINATDHEQDKLEILESVLDARMHAPMERRDFLRGAFLRREGQR